MNNPSTILCAKKGNNDLIYHMLCHIIGLDKSGYQGK